jgi:hypothetical protein
MQIDIHPIFAIRPQDHNRIIQFNRPIAQPPMNALARQRFSGKMPREKFRHARPAQASDGNRPGSAGRQDHHGVFIATRSQFRQLLFGSLATDRLYKGCHVHTISAEISRLI